MGSFPFFRKDKTREATTTQGAAEQSPSEPRPRGPRKKDAPTPTRKQAEAARMARLNPQLDKKEAKRRNAEANREQRMKAIAARDGTPEKALMRDVVDARWNLGEFLLPMMLLMLALTFLQPRYPQLATVTMIGMYGYIGLVVVDLVIMWRRFKRIHAERHPGVSTKGKGLVMYGCNRAVQLRRIRLPKPVVERGQKL